MKNSIIIALTLVILVGGYFLLKGLSHTSSNASSNFTSLSANNVSMENGIQVVIINAHGGFQPQKSLAKAGIPTILRFVTDGTFDCSSSIRIPSLNVSKVLAQTGNTDIDANTPTSGVLQGTCGMGMYRFEVDFQS